MRTHMVVGLVALVGLAGVAPPVAAQEATAEVRTWSGESWLLMQPSLEVFYTIMPKGEAGVTSKGMQSMESAVTGGGMLEQTRTAESQAPKQGHAQREVVTLFREGAEMQIPFARIRSLQFFRQPVEKSNLPPYEAATHFRYFATAELMDGSRVEGDYVNLGTTVLRGLTPQGRVDIPWEEIENIRFEPEGIPQPTREEERVALASVIAEPAALTPKAPAPAKRQIPPPREVSHIPKPAIREEEVMVPAPNVPESLQQETAPSKEPPKIPEPTAEEEKVALAPSVTEPPVPIPKVPVPAERDVVFDFDSLLLTADAKVVLEEFGKWLKANPDAKVVMRGHCDEPERGTNAYNRALGELRLRAIREYLLAAGIDGRRVSTPSQAEQRPTFLGHDEPAWKCHRRVHLTVVKSDGPLR